MTSADSAPPRAQREMVSLMAARVRDAVLRKPHFTDAGTDLVTLCRDLSAQGITDALVRDGARLGIFTATDLVGALTRDRPPSALTVGEFTHFEPWSVGADDALYDAMLLMLRHRIHRVLVREGGQVVGILSQLDLMGFVANHSHLISAEVAQAGTVVELARPAGQVEGLIRVLHGDGVRIEIIAGLVGGLNRQIFRRLWDLLAPEPLRANSCLIVMGSEGRSEQIIRTDQDNALILRDGFDFPGLDRITAAFTEALIGFGYPPCPGGIMLSRPLWCQSVEGFGAVLYDWVHGSDPEGPMNLAIFLDAASVAGDEALLGQVQDRLRRVLTGGDSYYARFAAAIQQFGSGSEGGWWRRLPGLRGPEAAEIDLKKLGIFPVVHGTRALALQYGIPAQPTAERLRLLAGAGRIDAGLARDLTDALHCMMGLKLASNLSQIAAGRAPDNSIRPVDLGTLDRQALRDSLNIVRDFKRWLAQHYRLDAL
ncbi:putative nucleotidyltransferase substrate binding domain-containing protein [Paracoccus aminovorans]|uniref:putative nucleotidyltransferase substrate binding domain-containing protein n=1 Tax=Paracoccus aminovorans TaxID=34004 RepID=UPI002B25CA37|nr:putative nucleotidyltransferase substrate binding domain-containing protein [Paracoccus aminovorans]